MWRRCWRWWGKSGHGTSRKFPPPAMFVPHRFVLRFTFASLGILLLMAVVFVALGWAVGQTLYVARAIGRERAARLEVWYAHAAEAMIPWDTDGDGIRDGLEIFVGSDARNPRRHPQIGFYARPTLFYCGERTPLRCGRFGYPEQWLWPRGFAVTITATSTLVDPNDRNSAVLFSNPGEFGVPVLLAKGATGPATAGPLTVRVPRDGYLEFDILGGQIFDDVSLNFTNVRTGERFSQAILISVVGWRGTPITPHLVKGSRRLEYPLISNKEEDRFAVDTFAWAASQEPVRRYVVEAARDEPGAEWRVIDLMHGQMTKSELGDRRDSDFPGYSGPLKFRIVPTRASPP